jgi:hypothetical protein
MKDILLFNFGFSDFLNGIFDIFGSDPACCQTERKTERRERRGEREYLFLDK